MVKFIAALSLLGSIAKANKSVCQKSTSRIVGGNSILDGDAPFVPSWQAGLSKPGSDLINCGGSFIANGWVLTAARCHYMLDATTNNADIHTVNLISAKVEFFAQSTSFIKHPDYNGSVHDIGLVSYCSGEKPPGIVSLPQPSTPIPISLYIAFIF